MEANNVSDVDEQQRNKSRVKGIFAFLKEKSYWFWVILIFAVFPIVLNYAIVNYEVPWKYVGDAKDWLGFFSNYASGVIGAIVALIVAQYQGELQKDHFERQLQENLAQAKDMQQKEIDKEIRQKRFAQLPALIMANHELDESIFSLRKIASLRNKSVELIRERNTKTGSEQEDSEIAEEVNRKVYELRPIDSNLFSHLQLVDDIGLQIDLYIKLNQYRDFAKALAIDLEGEEWRYLPEQNQDLYIAVYEAGEIKARKQLVIGKKEEFWNFIESNYIGQLGVLHKKVKLEIDAIKELKNNK
ncbi:hypothetical protein COJ48_19575 [Bacillus cereus]|nr:hypothetical protein COJ48_19575 [Bacillus cereus]PGP88966.1 hypothetical protein CN997_01500 [Bacillus cereus]